MKEIQNMTLEELIEFDNNSKVLSWLEIQLQEYHKVINNTSYKITDSREIYDNYRKSLPIRIELERLYNHLLEDLIEEIDKSSFDKDSLTLCILVGSYLVPNGLLSYTKKFHNIISAKEASKIINNDFNFFTQRYFELTGIYTIAGYGCCRHINSFMSDLLRTKGINSDKIPCIRTNTEGEIKERLESFNFNLNHVIIGYIENNAYYMVDCYNRIYTYQKEKHFYYNDFHYIIPDFTDTLLQDNSFYFHPGIPYTSFSNKEIDERIIKIQKQVNEGEHERFLQFKQNHLDLYEKIAYLIPLELERTEEKEKLKRI